MACRGVRGATTVEQDQPEEVLTATRELLAAMIFANDMKSEDVASIIFTTTADVVSVYPAVGARQLGWVDVPLICAQEMQVAGSLTHCIRIMLHWNTDQPQGEVQHVFMNEAKRLRPDILSGISDKDMAIIREWIQQQLEKKT